MEQPEKSKSSSSFLARLFGFGGAKSLQAEKNRLEAFLAAYPGSFLGIAQDGSVIVSDSLYEILGVQTIQSVLDFESQLSPDDAAALEGMLERLQKANTPFSVSVLTADEEKRLKITGMPGRATDNETRYDVLWIDDVSSEVQAHQQFMEDISFKEAETEKLKTMLDHIPRPLWLRNTEQEIVWVNATYADFLDKHVEEILEDQREVFGQLRKKTAGPGETLPGPEMAAQALRSNAPVEARIHTIIKGSRMLMNITEIPMPHLEMTMGIAYNVTREEELETQMKRYQSSNQELLEHLRSAVAIFSADQSLEFYNLAFSQLWDLKDEWLNKAPKLGDLLEKLRETRRLPEQADFRAFKKHWMDMFTSLIHSFDDMMYLPDGSALRVLVVPSSNGGLMMTFEDVTSRLALESSYNTLIAVQQETLDNLAEAVAVYGGDGRLKLCNPSFERMWNLTPEDTEGEPHISKLVDKKQSYFSESEWPAKRDDLISKGLDRIMHEGRLERSDDSLIDFTTVPLPDGGVLVTYTDVSDSVRVENALRDKNTALETAENLKLDFLANVSYQLRTPLSAIMGFNDILHEEYFGPLNERQKQYTKDIQKASHSLLELVNDILDLSTLEAGYMTLNRSDIKIKDMLENVVNLLSEWARKSKVEIHVKCPKNIGKLTADESRIKQVLVNLVRNSITHTPEGGEISIQAKRKKDGIEILVADNGVGIKAEDRKRIFEPFQRAQAGSIEARLSKKGAGLGLSLVKNIVSLHGGEVDLKSEQGKGTTVKLFFPFTAVPTNLKLPMNKKERAEKTKQNA